MNLIDFYVTEVLSEPEFKYGKWWLNVMADGYGIISEHELMFNTEEECLSVSVGYKFLG